MKETISVPVQATMQIIDGEAVMVSAEYADIPVDDVARFLMKGFGLSPA